MKAIITGSSGFLGKHLLNHLQKNGVEVFTIGRGAISRNHLTYKSLADTESLSNFITKIEPQFIFHLAGIVEFEDEKKSYEVNVDYCYKILSCLKNNHLFEKTKLIAFGSAAEYGPISESDLPLKESHKENPGDLYGKSKLAQSQLIQSFDPRLQYLIFRPFTLIGKGMPEHLAIGSFAAQINGILADDTKEKIIQTGYLGTKRDFLGINLAIKWIWEASKIFNSPSGIYNLCSGSPTEIQEILEFLISESGEEIKLNQSVIDIRKVNMPIHFGDNTKLLSLLNHDMNESITDWKREAQQMILK